MEYFNTIFVYGTLSFDEIISALLGRKVRGKQAKIHGYKRVRIAGKKYPGLIKDTDKKLVVEGMVHSDITQEELELLNIFEDDFYKLVNEKTELKNSNSKIALTYIIPPKNLHFASNEIWDRESFREKHFNDYINMVIEFRQNYLSGIRKSQEF